MAVKVIGPQYGVAPRLLRRERDIADKLQGIEADHLIQVLDTGQLADDLLLVMERASGSLAGYLSDHGRLHEQEAISILSDISAGLRELHQASVIHRDLKPGNVLLHDERWKLSDFGIARDAELGTGQPTFLGLGSLAYMAPETWRGQSPSFKTDFYSIGCVGFELLSGSPPFPGPAYEDYEQQHLEQLPPSNQVSSGALSRLILRLLRKDPAERPQDARSVEEALHRIQGAGRRAADGRLSSLAEEHAEERSQEDAAKSAREARESRREELGRQAAQDLEDILTEAAEAVSAELPEADVSFSWNGSVPRIAGTDATLEVRLHSHARIEDDMPVGMGEIFGENRRTTDKWRLANIVYEATEGGRYGWNLYRFRKQGIVGDYAYGPGDREHGLSVDHFIQDREHMLRNAAHVWAFRRIALIAEALVDLYTEAMALPNPRS